LMFFHLPPLRKRLAILPRQPWRSYHSIELAL
jgi:hypothetical protein